jgi:dephospho-CoA kinase
MKNSFVLAICGHAGAGKDMVADRLIQTMEFQRHALADPIKEILERYFFVPSGQLYTSHKPPKVREALQLLGTEVGRNFDPDLWVKHLCNRIDSSTSPRIVVSDVRFPNEAETLRKRYGAAVILIRRPDNPNYSNRLMDHTSETSIEDIPFDEFKTAFINLEGMQEEMLGHVCSNVKEWIRCHNFQRTL